MSKKLMLIVNPASGRGQYRAMFGEAMHELALGGFETTLFFTKQRGDAAVFTREHATNFDVVACVGGDGTLSEVLGGLMQFNNPPPVGYIPMGTANDVATTIGLPKNDTVGAVERIINGTPHPYDVGGFGDEGYFAYIAAFGAFTEVSYATPQSQKKVLGHLAYVLGGMAQLPKIESVRTRVEYDGGVIEEDLLYGSVSNSTSVAGILRLREDLVSLGDGMSELVLVKNPGSIQEFAEIVDGVINQGYNNESLLILHTTKARFTFEKPVAWTRDGENGGEHQVLELRNYKCPVQLIF